MLALNAFIVIVPCISIFVTVYWMQPVEMFSAIYNVFVNYYNFQSHCALSLKIPYVCDNYNFHQHDNFSVIRHSKLSLMDFYNDYDGKWPVIISDVINAFGVANWSAEFLVKYYGEDKVVMKTVEGNLSAAFSAATKLRSFYEKLSDASFDKWTYVEDELFISTKKALVADMPFPVYCEENFFSLFPEEIRPWGNMLLWGSKYSRSPLHIDPYNWTGTNAVIWGRKHWKLYKPGNDHLFYINHNQMAGFPLPSFKYNSPIDAMAPDFVHFPLFRDAIAMEFDQQAGEMLFIPPGWFHQAMNIEETLAISGQLMNRNNWRIVLEEIFKASPYLRQQLPDHIDALTPRNQIEIVLGLIPKEVLENGRKITENILAQIFAE